MSKKKKNCLFRVDGFEEWMDQFCSGSYLNCNFPNYIHIDLCETEQEYILETDVPNVTEQNVFIKKDGDRPKHLYFQKKCSLTKNDFFTGQYRLQKNDSLYREWFSFHSYI